MKTSKEFKKTIKVIVTVLFTLVALLFWLNQASLFVFGTTFPLEFFECITSITLITSISFSQFMYVLLLLAVLALSIIGGLLIIKKINIKYLLIGITLSLIFGGYLFNEFIYGYAIIRNGTVILRNINDRLPEIKKVRVSHDSRLNVIIIVLEGIDNFWLSKGSGNLMHRTKKIMERNVNFSNIKQSRYGFSSDTGINDAFTVGKKVAVTNILGVAKYNQVAMMGFDQKYISYGRLLKSFSYDDIIDGDLTDSELFDNAFVKYKEMLKKDSPFNLTIVTKDTHDVIGDSVDNFVQYHEVLDASLSKFIKAVQKTDKNTIIVVFNDHYQRGTKFAKELEAFKHKRRMVFFIVDNNKTKNVKNSGTTSNIGSTILAMMKIKHNNKHLNKYIIPVH